MKRMFLQHFNLISHPPLSNFQHAALAFRPCIISSVQMVVTMLKLWCVETDAADAHVAAHRLAPLLQMCTLLLSDKAALVLELVDAMCPALTARQHEQLLSNWNMNAANVEARQLAPAALLETLAAEVEAAQVSVLLIFSPLPKSLHVLNLLNVTHSRPGCLCLLLFHQHAGGGGGGSLLFDAYELPELHLDSLQLGECYLAQVFPCHDWHMYDVMFLLRLLSSTDLFALQVPPPTALLQHPAFAFLGVDDALHT